MGLESSAACSWLILFFPPNFAIFKQWTHTCPSDTCFLPVTSSGTFNCHSYLDDQFCTPLTYQMSVSSQAIHKAVVKVDETGTEAAAATGMEIVPMSVPVIVRFNRPFLMVINMDNTILFMGKIVNPLKRN